MTVASNAARPARADSMFFSGMALAMAAVVFTGFAPTWFLRFYFQPPEPLSQLRVIHGVAFTLWVLLFIAQTSLVAANRRDIHRKLGWWGAGLAIVMLVLGWMAAMDSLRRGATPVPGLSPASFFVVPTSALALFALFVLLGILNRKRPDHHKRYMLMSMNVLLVPAVARIFLQTKIPALLAGFAVSDVFLLVLMAYDYHLRGRVNRATWIAAAILIASEPGRVIIGQTHWWQAFANSLV
jgi:FtsH-binding integral membrane protein